MTETEPTLAVIGAINVDLVVSGAPLPRPGGTVVGGTFARHHGGKGGNQAVAAARVLGRSVAGSAGGPRVVMIGAVGDDDMGRAALDDLAGEGVDVRSVDTKAGVPTGVALIVVDEQGENQIAVAQGANAGLSASAVRNALDHVGPRAALASLEVPPDAVRAGAEWCREHGTTFILNPAPAIPEARELAGLSSYLTPNEGELSNLGPLPDGVAVVETRGARGASVHARGETRDMAAPAVDVVDTTGAGDCFNGVFAAGLVEGLDLFDAVRRAVVAATLSVTARGAREGMPGPEALSAILR